MIGRIHSIESFGTVDGPGIRMVVFLSGCPMRCLYCHNPDTWDPKGGTPMTAEQILAQYRSAAHFYRRGGITVTGGEPLLQIGFVPELFEAARKEGIPTCLDTSGTPEAVRAFPEAGSGLRHLSGGKKSAGMDSPCGGPRDYGQRPVPLPTWIVSGYPDQYQGPGCAALPRSG